MPAVLTMPALSIELDGSALDPADAARLTGCRVRQASGAPDQAELRFLGAAPAAASPGASMHLQVPDAVPLFAGAVTALEHELAADGVLTTRVRGYDRLHALRLGGSVRLWEDVTVADVARQLAASAGLAVQAAQEGPRLARVLQHGASDLDFLVRLAARAGLEVHLRQDTLHLHPLGRRIGDEMALTWGENLRSARLDANPGAGPRRIEFHGQDLGALESAGELRRDSDTAPEPPVDMAVPAADRSTLARPAVPVLGGDDATWLLAAERAHQAAAAWVVRGSAAGDPRLRPGTGVRISAGPAAPELERSFVLTEAVHTLDGGGFVTAFGSEPRRPAPADVGPAGRGSAPPQVAIATVTDVDDPEGAGRVRATLDAYDGAQTAWLPVLAPAAGPDSGLLAQPDVGARVLVLSAGLDPGAGVVLGALFTGPVPDPAVDGGRSRRAAWRSSGGQRIGLDDVESALTLSDAGGSRVRLEPGLLTVAAVGDLHLSAPGRAIVITAASVDFVEG